MLPKPSSIPAKSGIYIFKNVHGKPLYIGKAANLKKRLCFYFQKNISERVRLLRREAASVDVEVLPTEFDALVREAELIKKYRPKFNVLMRDDKSYYYVVFTRELFPRIIVTHQPLMAYSAEHRAYSGYVKKETPLCHTPYAISRVMGPFTEGRPLFSILRLLRKSFPYCTCKKFHKRTCLNAAIGRCAGFCCILGKKITRKEEKMYRKNINAIRKILSGKSQFLLRALKKEMERASREKRFEDAARFRDQWSNLQSIISHRYIIEDHNPFILRHAKTSSYLQKFLRVKTPPSRIEGYDISNISGKDATASLVVFMDGKPEKNGYKRFRIHFRGISDVDMLKEVIGRRLRHADWPLPDIMVIDGGMPQIRGIATVLASFFKTKNPALWPLVLAGLSKAHRPSGAVRRKASGEEMLHIWPRKTILLKNLPADTMHLLQAVRDEAHRFARRYHHLLRTKAVSETEPLSDSKQNGEFEEIKKPIVWNG